MLANFLAMKRTSIFFGSNNHRNWKWRENILLKQRMDSEPLSKGRTICLNNLKEKE
jgi:hypothetical protein